MGSKMKDVKTAADEELAPFKAKEESKHGQDLAALKATNDISADLAKSTKSELDMVKNEFESNKKKVTDFVIGKVLDVDINKHLLFEHANYVLRFKKKKQTQKKHT